MTKGMRKKINKNKEIQAILKSEKWRNDILGLLINKVIRMGVKLGATESDMYEYLEMS